MIVASDGELLGSFVENRDAKAFEVLMTRHGPRVLRVCRQVLGSSQDAEDAFQSTFLLLAGKAGSIQKGDSLGHWLHGAAHRIAVRSRVDATRRRRRESKPRQTSEESEPAKVETDEVLRILHEEIDRLPAWLRDPIRLCYLEGITNRGRPAPWLSPEHLEGAARWCAIDCAPGSITEDSSSPRCSS